MKNDHESLDKESTLESDTPAVSTGESAPPKNTPTKRKGFSFFRRNKEKASIEEPLKAPVEVPLEASIEVPLKAPIEVPLKAPTEAPVDAPAEASIEAPAEVLIEAPIEQASDVQTSTEIKTAAPEIEAPIPEGRKSATAKRSLFRRALSRTGAGFGDLFLGKKTIDASLYDDLETQLLVADLGVETCEAVIRELSERVSRRNLADVEALRSELGALLEDILIPCQQPLGLREHLAAGDKGPFVMLVVGVNGVGKTTTIGKLTKRFQQQGLSVMLAAGDTFRAAAVEQLQVWGERNNVPVIAQHTGADSASVIFDAIQSGQARGVDVIIADTAGRLHNKDQLMDELVKVKRVMAKLDAAAPHETLLVLDAGTGQNAIAQLRQFNEAVDISGIALTKLDGTAKGGVIFALCKQFGVPIRFVGMGEGVDDLQPFDAKIFVDALLASPDDDS